MKTLTAAINWLNGESTARLPLQHDGIYPMMSWQNLRVAQTLGGPSFATLAWLMVLVMAVPMLVLG